MLNKYLNLGVISPTHDSPKLFSKPLDSIVRNFLQVEALSQQTIQPAS